MSAAPFMSKLLQNLLKIGHFKGHVIGCRLCEHFLRRPCFKEQLNNYENGFSEKSPLRYTHYLMHYLDVFTISTKKKANDSLPCCEYVVSYWSCLVISCCDSGQKMCPLCWNHCTGQDQNQGNDLHTLIHFAELNKLVHFCGSFYELTFAELLAEHRTF